MAPSMLIRIGGCGWRRYFVWRPPTMALAALKGAAPSRPEMKLILSRVVGFATLGPKT